MGGQTLPSNPNLFDDFPSLKVTDKARLSRFTKRTAHFTTDLRRNAHAKSALSLQGDPNGFNEVSVVCAKGKLDEGIEFRGLGFYDL
jgi:hypothetical protein